MVGIVSKHSKEEMIESFKVVKDITELEDVNVAIMCLGSRDLLEEERKYIALRN